jgi:NAD(P)-dependent dehydrogenase (short-subunit alcohol dehydrogenase family)
MTTQHLIAGKTIMVTGANRGIGKALTQEAIEEAARTVGSLTS